MISISAWQELRSSVAPIGWLNGKPMPAFAFHDFGALLSLAQYDGRSSLGKFGLFQGVSIKGRLGQRNHAHLYRTHQERIQGFWKGGLIWLVDRLNRRLLPSIGLGSAGTFFFGITATRSQT